MVCPKCVTESNPEEGILQNGIHYKNGDPWEPEMLSLIRQVIQCERCDTLYLADQERLQYKKSLQYVPVSPEQVQQLAPRAEQPTVLLKQLKDLRQKVRKERESLEIERVDMQNAEKEGSNEWRGLERRMDENRDKCITVDELYTKLLRNDDYVYKVYSEMPISPALKKGIDMVSAEILAKYEEDGSAISEKTLLFKATSLLWRDEPEIFDWEIAGDQVFSQMAKPVEEENKGQGSLALSDLLNDLLEEFGDEDLIRD